MDNLKEDHNKREFKRFVIGGILDLVRKSSKTREALYKLSTIEHNSINTGTSENTI